MQEAIGPAVGSLTGQDVNLQLPLGEGVPDGSDEHILVLLLVGGHAEAHRSIPGHVLSPVAAGVQLLPNKIMLQNLPHNVLGDGGILHVAQSGDGGGDAIHGVGRPHKPLPQWGLRAESLTDIDALSQKYYLGESPGASLEHEVNCVNHHPVVEDVVTTHEVEVKYSHSGGHHVGAGLHGAEGSLPLDIGIGGGGGRGLLSGKDHLVEGCIVKSHVVRDVLVVPPFLDPCAVVHCFIR